MLRVRGNFGNLFTTDVNAYSEYESYELQIHTPSQNTINGQI